MPTGESIDSNRFQVRRRIGSGAFGVVYEAFDPVRNQVVAIKALRRATPEALYRFKREFRSLSGIAHRNLVRLYELIAEGEQWLVSMELVRGTTFIEHVRREATVPDGPLQPMRADIGRLRVALTQLVHGVNALHNAGKLHRDIKPSNVLVADDRRVVLLDFGLVMDTDPRAAEQSTSTSGTPAYMSPEQGAGFPLGPASDWYSVGVMLYDTLTGQVPFSGGTYVEVINRKINGDVPPPSTIASGIPEDIDALCRDLLRREPRDRPTGDEILQRLGRTMPSAGATKAAPSTPLIGRDEPLRELREAFYTTIDGAQTTVCVTGLSGAGKTALIRAFLDRLRDEIPELLVLTARCYHRESLRYKGVDSLIDALHRYLWRLQPHEVDALLPRDIAAAEQLFPVLTDVADIARSRRRGGTTIPSEPDVRRRAFAAIREMFLRLSDRIALVLVIDDLQWAGADSAELMREMLRSPDAPPLLFIAAYRSDEAETSPFVQAFRKEMPVRDIEVAPLTLDDSGQLAESLLGESIADAREVANMIADQSAGNPSFIEELARSFALAGDASRHATADAIISEVLQARLRRLESGAARMLQYVAVNAQPIPMPALRLAFRRDDFEDTLTTLAGQHLIRTRDTSAGEAVETSHQHISRAALALLSEDELRDMHAVLALALEDFAGADAALVAAHFTAAGMPERAAKYAGRARE